MSKIFKKFIGFQPISTFDTVDENLINWSDNLKVTIRRESFNEIHSATSSTASFTSKSFNSLIVPLIAASKRKNTKGKMGATTEAIDDVQTAQQKEQNLLNARPTLEFISDDEKKNHYIVDSDISLKKEKDVKRNANNFTSLLMQILATVAVSLGSVVVGFSSAYTSPALVSMNSTDSILRVNEQEESWIGSTLPLSALVGGIVGGLLIEKFGRKKTIQATAIPFILSYILIAMANNVFMILGGRAVGGFCIGIVSLALPVYLGEALEPNIRGKLGLVPTTLGNGGILLCFTIGKYLDWSKLAFFGAILPIPFLLMMFFVPETPHWYISKNKIKQASKSLKLLRDSQTDINKELSEISSSIATSENLPLRQMLSLRYTKPLMITLGLMLFQQFSGINAVIFYVEKIFGDASKAIDANTSSVIIGFVNVASVFIATGLIDRLGRKILLTISTVTMATTLISLGTFFYIKESKILSIEHVEWLPLVSCVLYVIGFSIGFGPIPWLMMGEILPTKVRGTAAAIATAFNWFCTFVVTKTFTDLKEWIGSSGVFWCFGVICLFGLYFVIFLVPETKGKSLEDIENFFIDIPQQSDESKHKNYNSKDTIIKV